MENTDTIKTSLQTPEVKITDSVKDTFTKCILMIVILSGIGLSYTGMLTEPVGEIHDSVLMGVGELLTFAGSIIGSGYYWGSKFRELRAELKRGQKA